MAIVCIRVIFKLLFMSLHGLEFVLLARSDGENHEKGEGTLCDAY